jgi:hypothetical protein
MSADGRFGLVRGIGVTLGQTHPDVLIQVSQGGTLRLKYTGSQETVWGHIALDGVAVGETGPIGRGSQRLLLMPAGSGVLTLSSKQTGFTRTKAVELKAGETKELTLTDED